MSCLGMLNRSWMLTGLLEPPVHPYMSGYEIAIVSLRKVTKAADEAEVAGMSTRKRLSKQHGTMWLDRLSLAQVDLQRCSGQCAERATKSKA
eukprot:4325132-Amphidinium_carterae.1